MGWGKELVKEATGRKEASVRRRASGSSLSWTAVEGEELTPCDVTISVQKGPVTVPERCTILAGQRKG